MANEPNSREQDIADHQEIQQSIRRLNRITSWLRQNTILTMVLQIAALAVLCVPVILGRAELAQESGVTTVVSGLIALMLFGNLYTLFYQRHFKAFRERLAEQMQVATKQRIRASKFYGMAILDPLTGLYNRRFGEECLQKEVERAEKTSGDLAVIVTDLDYFKEINDKYGHAAGDLVLREFSRHLKRALRACDFAVRTGGDEFLVVLPECSNENVHIILSRLTPFDVTLNRRKVKISYSRGRAQYQHTDTPETMKQRADKVLYDEKAARKAVTV
jgi:diguanylate cyclase (GGDEF)-like protein